MLRPGSCIPRSSSKLSAARASWAEECFLANALGDAPCMSSTIGSQTPGWHDWNRVSIEILTPIGPKNYVMARRWGELKR